MKCSPSRFHGHKLRVPMFKQPHRVILGVYPSISPLISHVLSLYIDGWTTMFSQISWKSWLKSQVFVREKPPFFMVKLPWSKWLLFFCPLLLVLSLPLEFFLSWFHWMKWHFVEEMWFKKREEQKKRIIEQNSGQIQRTAKLQINISWDDCRC